MCFFLWQITGWALYLILFNLQFYLHCQSQVWNSDEHFIGQKSHLKGFPSLLENLSLKETMLCSHFIMVSASRASFVNNIKKNSKVALSEWLQMHLFPEQNNQLRRCTQQIARESKIGIDCGADSERSSSRSRKALCSSYWSNKTSITRKAVFNFVLILLRVAK